MLADWLIIDGNNLIHSQPSWLGSKPARDFDGCRLELSRKLEGLTGAVCRRLTLVFDGTIGGRDDRKHGQEFEVVFTAEISSADAMIERLVAGAPAGTSILVVTDDHVERCVVEAAGGRTMSCRQFISEATEGGSRLTKALRPSSPNARRATLGDFFPR